MPAITPTLAQVAAVARPAMTPALGHMPPLEAPRHGEAARDAVGADGGAYESGRHAESACSGEQVRVLQSLVNMFDIPLECAV